MKSQIGVLVWPHQLFQTSCVDYLKALRLLSMTFLMLVVYGQMKLLGSPYYIAELKQQIDRFLINVFLEESWALGKVHTFSITSKQFCRYYLQRFNKMLVCVYVCNWIEVTPFTALKLWPNNHVVTYLEIFFSNI